MRRRKSAPPAIRPNSDWTVTTELQVNNRFVSPGTELKIAGHRGRFRFIKHVNTGSAQWVDVWGGPKGMESIRSFRLEQIKTVHSKNQTISNLAAEYKEKQKKKKEEVSN